MKQIIFVCFIAIMFTSCEKGPRVIQIETDFGNMDVELYDDTPLHRDNMVKLVQEGFYDDLLFHRVMPKFMMQGGDPVSKGAPATARLGGGGPGYEINAEIKHVHTKGALCAARTGDAINPAKKSSGSQFYIVQGTAVTNELLDKLEAEKGIKYTPEQRAKYLKVGGAPFLDNAYTVYGEVIDGMEVIDKICAVPTQPGDRPTNDVKMKIKLIN